jgi:hypothetical protein
MVSAEVTGLDHAVDVTTLEHRDAKELGLNDIGRLTLTAARPLIYDAYKQNRATGAFILIDRMTNATMGAGMILGPAAESAARTGDLGRVTVAERERRLGQKGTILAIPDVAVAASLERKLWDLGYTACVLESSAGGAERAHTLAAAYAELGLIAIVAGVLDEAAFARDRVLAVKAEPNAPADRAIDLALAALRQSGSIA